MNYCSMCGAPIDSPIMIEGADAYICMHCASLIADTFNEIQRVSKEKIDSEEIPSEYKLPTPQEIKEFLDSYIIGQDRAKIAVCTAVYNHYKRINQPEVKDDVNIEKSNICIVGPTGTGKCISGDTKVKVRNKKTGEIYYDTINNLKNMLITNSAKDYNI